MVAHDEAAAFEIIESQAQITDLTCRRVIRREQLVLLAGHHRFRLVLGEAGKGLGDDELDGGRQKPVEKSGLRRGGVFLEAEEPSVGRAPRAADFDSLPAEDEPARVERRSDRSLHEGHRKALARYELVQERGWLRERDPVSIFEPEPPRSVGSERRDGIASRVLELFERSQSTAGPRLRERPKPVKKSAARSIGSRPGCQTRVSVSSLMKRSWAARRAR